MLRLLMSGLLVGAVMVSFAPAVDAAGRKYNSYRSGPQVKGYVERRGGYSYSYLDSINTYGDSRTVHGGASVYRDPQLDKQTVNGPFDHGFFFDSGVAGPHGGDAPAMN